MLRNNLIIIPVGTTIEKVSLDGWEMLWEDRTENWLNKYTTKKHEKRRGLPLFVAGKVLTEEGKKKSMVRGCTR